VQDIAERAALNRATFYAHFEDKFALADYMIRDLFHEALSARLAPRAPFSVHNLGLLVSTVADLLGGLHGHCAPAHHELQPAVEATIQEELCAYLLAWLQQAAPAEGTQNIPRETVASVMSWAIFGVGVEWGRGTRTQFADDWVRQVLEVLVSGIARVVSIPTPVHA
jgi:AcrR family transcriptional regulator